MRGSLIAVDCYGSAHKKTPQFTSCFALPYYLEFGGYHTKGEYSQGGFS